jgi:hypothetical protein
MASLGLEPKYFFQSSGFTHPAGRTVPVSLYITTSLLMGSRVSPSLQNSNIRNAKKQLLPLQSTQLLIPN